MSLAFRIVVAGLWECVLWHMRSKPRQAFLYGPAILLAVLARVDLQTRSAILLSLAHAGIHQQWPYIDEHGYNHKDSPLYDVVCHQVMLAYAHLSFRTKFEGIACIVVDFATGIAFLVGLANCALASRLRQDDDKPAVRWWFEHTSIAQAFSSAYFMLVLIADIPAGTLWIWAWLASQFVYLLNWVLFLRFGQEWLGHFFSRDYFAFAFIVPSCFGTLCSMIK